MENTIVKPITVAHADFVSELTNMVNNSGLPPFILEPIFKNMLNDIRVVAKKQLDEDRKQYQAMLDADTEKGD